MGWWKEERTVEKVEVQIINIAFKTTAQFIYNKKEIEQVLENYMMI